MTVSATDSTAVFDGNGVTTNFPFNFTFDNDSEIKVYSKEVATGIVTELTSGFTVNGAGDDDGGSVDMDVAPATGFKLVVSRELVLEQQTDLRNRGNFFPEVHEKVFDRLTKMIQQVSYDVSRCIKADISESSPDDIIASLNAIASAADDSASSASASAGAASGSASAASSSASAASGSAVAAAASAASMVDYLNTSRINIASASTVDLTVGAPSTRHIKITGTTAITKFTVASGQCYFVRFAGVLTLTNGADLVTQTGADITTEAGDTCLIRATANDVVEVLCYVRGIKQSIGYGQTWQDVNGSRSASTTYTNSTGMPICVSAAVQSSGGPTANTITLQIGALNVSKGTYYAGNANHGGVVFGIVPPGETYKISISGGSITTWKELR